MKLNQLRDFVAVAERGSLRAAARETGLAQPAITRSIQALEYSLNAQLFVREPRGVRLTPVGKDFLLRAMSILNEVRRAGESVRQRQGDVDGELALGFSIATHFGIFAEVISAFKRRFPKVRLRIIEGFFPTLENDLRNGLLDFYAGPMPDVGYPADMLITKLFDNNRVVVGRRGHPLRGARKLSDLTEAEWMTTSITRDAPDELKQVFAEHRLPMPRLLFQTQTALSTLMTMINTDALAMMPVQWVEAPLVAGWLEQLPLEQHFAAPPIMLVRRAGLGLTPAGEYFVHLVEQLAGQGGISSDANSISFRKF